MRATIEQPEVAFTQRKRKQTSAGQVTPSEDAPGSHVALATQSQGLRLEQDFEGLKCSLHLWDLKEPILCLIGNHSLGHVFSSITCGTPLLCRLQDGLLNSSGGEISNQHFDPPSPRPLEEHICQRGERLWLPPLPCLQQEQMM